MEIEETSRFARYLASSNSLNHSTTKLDNTEYHDNLILLNIMMIFVLQNVRLEIVTGQKKI